MTFNEDLTQTGNRAGPPPDTQQTQQQRYRDVPTHVTAVPPADMDEPVAMTTAPTHPASRDHGDAARQWTEHAAQHADESNRRARRSAPSPLREETVGDRNYTNGPDPWGTGRQTGTSADSSTWRQRSGAPGKPSGATRHSSRSGERLPRSAGRSDNVASSAPRRRAVETSAEGDNASELSSTPIVNQRGNRRTGDEPLQYDKPDEAV